MSEDCRETPDYTTHTDLPVCPFCGSELGVPIPASDKQWKGCDDCGEDVFVIRERLFSTYKEDPRR